MRSLLLVSLGLTTALSPLMAQDFHEFLPAGLVPPLELDWRAVAAGDIDGDGDLDLVFANYGTPGVGQRNIWMRNDGTGLFARMPDTALRLGPSLSRAVLLADFDRDGDLDAFFGNQRLDAICRNDGRGELASSPGDLPALDRTTYAAASGDIDGDGDIDIVAACGGNDIVYLNDGAGRFSDGSARLPAAWDLTVALELADFDGDGDLDLLRVNQDAPSQLLLNDGSGQFVASGLALPTGAFVTSGDVDGDGRRDFVFGVYIPPIMNPPLYETVIYRNRGGLTFDTTALPRRSAYAPHPARLVDLDGDLDLDLAIAGDRVLHNDGLGNFTAGAEQTWIGDTFADIDGDGDRDLIGIPTLRNDGHGRFALPAHLPALLDTGSRVLAMIDFDLDGDLDLVRQSQDRSQVEVLSNDGRGTFRGTLAAAPNNTWSSDPWPAADWTGDGYPDLIVGYPGVLFQNVAGRGFAPRALPEPVGRFVSLDADGDADLDLIFQRSDASVAWYRNDGGGAFSPGSALLIGRVGALLTAADLDGDARQDLVLTDLNGLVVALRCTGNGVFTVLPNAFPSVPETIAAFAADLDGDGDRDCVLCHGYGANLAPRITVLRNDGTGRFAVAATLVPPTVLSTVSGVVGADFDEDGDIDLVAYGSPFVYESARFLRNDGGFAFVDATGSSGPWLGFPSTLGYPLLGDIDRDGDVDVVASHFSRTTVLHNLRRQLALGSDPALGGNWQIDIVQRPIGLGVGGVVLSFAELAPPLATPFGLLRVDLSLATVFDFVAVAQAAPVTVVTLPVPNQLSLRGLPLFVQNVAFDGQAVRLGNQLRAVVQ